MARPAFGTEKVKETCAICNQTVWIPPGQYYRGEPMHKFCARYQSKADYGNENLEPWLDNLEDSLRELLPDTQSI
jgi:hypothetical protein